VALLHLAALEGGILTFISFSADNLAFFVVKLHVLAVVSCPFRVFVDIINEAGLFSLTVSEHVVLTEFKAESSWALEGSIFRSLAPLVPMSLVEEKLVAEAFPLLTFINEVGPAVDFFVFTGINILEHFALGEAHIAIDTASSVKTLFKDWLKAGRFGLRRGNSEMFHNLVARAFPESTIDGDLSVAASIVLTDAGGDIPVLAGFKARNLGRVIIEAHVGTIPLVFAAWRFKTKDLFHDSVALTFEKLSVVVDLNVAADLLERASVVLNPVVAGLKESFALKQIHTVSWANLIDSALFGAVESTVASEEHVHNVVTGSFNHLAVNLTTNLAVQFTIAILHFPELAGL
jgi:hypothetical protein